MLQKILVANRGEIAARIFQACHELNIRTVAITSTADEGAAWTRLADECYSIAGMTAAETYLVPEKILAMATQAKVDGIHPGYGFLSENAGFAQACADAGITFIGPTPEAIRVMGSKAEARRVAQEAGVPVVPGADGAGKTADELRQIAQEIGYPILIKASAGGGGKGMRVVWSEAELADGIQAARREAQSSFGDDHILLEKFFTEIHHVEVQVLGDRHGKVVHLFERECSIQRRHQKIIEETPSPTIKIPLRERICDAAVALAEAVGYVNAGTVEFIVDNAGNFYLLEMNTRLQVEHPITEKVTGLDLATWQIRIASGEALSFGQRDLRQQGHALECRVYAEDPAHHFLPSIGEIAFYRPPEGPGVRVDAGIASGSHVTPYYDPMLAKVITWGQDRTEAIHKMRSALQQTVVLGVTTNIPYLLDILQHPEFVAGHTPTNFLETQMPAWSSPPPPEQEALLAMAVFELLGKQSQQGATVTSKRGEESDPWAQHNSWRNVVMY